VRYKVINATAIDAETRINAAAAQGWLLHSWHPVGVQARVFIIMQREGHDEESDRSRAANPSPVGS
jgi:hypothetical protein